MCTITKFDDVLVFEVTVEVFVKLVKYLYSIKFMKESSVFLMQMFYGWVEITNKKTKRPHWLYNFFVGDKSHYICNLWLRKYVIIKSPPSWVT